MTAWHLGMLLVLPLALSQPKMRTWAAMMLAGTIPWLLPEMSVPAYIVIDALAGAVVLRRPAGCAQRTIGACFALLVMFHVGWLVSSAQADTILYYQANVVTGWVQFVLLATRGLADVGKALLHWRGARSRLSAIDAGIR